ncbi:nucleoside-diphosphate sugar epimerase/dehydratase [Microbacterium sp. PRC9]|uniref:polysaccharide biosynthesis protein n=1 Tax=Microbacterium sp. PRC9 TaxID=2962591 RepID=UPI0028813366|nr:nucleoside-diphosphate sugar epimerase/dehydratase [Microbacterium sp. PRC9]MDT0141482.1 nucleoside-diphosphate sugar epimerase/dehydratase [Microbacterium sp. PRC9]
MSSPTVVADAGNRFRRRVLAAVVDGAAWVIAILIAVVLRFEFDPEPVRWTSTIILTLAAAGLHAALGYATGLYRGRFPYGSFDEVRTLAVVVVIEALLLATVVIAFGNVIGIPRSTIFIAFPFVLLFMFGVRYTSRLLLEHRRKPSAGAPRALIVGGGHLGETLLRSIMTDPKSPLRPVGVIDDDPAKRNLRLRGVPVLGRIDQIQEVARKTDAEIVVIAIGYADSVLLRRITETSERADLKVFVTPTVSKLVSGDVSVDDLRDISIEDLIGRHPVDTEIESIAGYITGRRVLVTGAGGSIGSELCRQLAKFGPEELIMLDRDETGLQMAQLGTAGHGLLDTKDVVLADIRDAETLKAIFAARRPDVVFHAAALKHLPMLEQYPDEAWKTNVIGTLNVINAARSVGVSTFVNISTDKAANPTSVLGHSKRVAEKLTAWAADDTRFRYLSVRFGNVIGSRGSMLPTFRALIEAGGPLTITHPDVTRYFMTIPEACQLVIQAGGIGRPGEVLILDMGEPVRILDVARRLILTSRKQIEIVFTGLREGEKLHEELVGRSEDLEQPFHPKISHARVDPITPERLDKSGWEARMFAGAEMVDTRDIEPVPSRRPPGVSGAN